MQQRVVSLGLPGWINVGGDFYPQELPDDWRLAYYAQCFECVWLPRVTWTPVAPAEIRVWLDEVPEHFRFLLEGFAGDTLPFLDAQLLLAAPSPDDGGVLLRPGREPDLRALGREIPRYVEAGTPVYLLAETTLQAGPLQILRDLLGY